jgi:hypothetical protein
LASRSIGESVGEQRPTFNYGIGCKNGELAFASTGATLTTIGTAQSTSESAISSKYHLAMSRQLTAIGSADLYEQTGGALAAHFVFPPPLSH